MPAQRRESSNNYIAILNDGIEELRPAEPPAKSDHRVKDYFLGLITGGLERAGGRRGEIVRAARAGPVRCQAPARAGTSRRMQNEIPELPQNAARQLYQSTD